MSRSLSLRLTKLEAATKPPVPRIPHVIHVERGETSEGALAAFHAAWPNVKRGHGLIILPARVSTPDEEAAFEVEFFAHQTKLIEDAKSETRKVKQDAHAVS